MNHVFYTVCDPNFIPMAQQWANSVRTFYPDSPVYTYIIDDYQAKAGQTIGEAGKTLSDYYDTVIYMNPDNIVCDKLPHLFGEFDIAMPQNNTEYQFNPIVKHYLNCGLTVVNNQEVWTDYLETFASRNYVYGEEQNALNLVFWSAKFRGEILDYDTDTYGILYQAGYDSIYLTDDKLMIGNKQVRVFHAAGGNYRNGNQFSFDSLQPDVAKRLQIITKGTLCR